MLQVHLGTASFSSIPTPLLSSSLSKIAAFDSLSLGEPRSRSRFDEDDDDDGRIEEDGRRHESKKSGGRSKSDRDVGLVAALFLSPVAAIELD